MVDAAKAEQTSAPSVEPKRPRRIRHNNGPIDVHLRVEE